VAAVFEKLEFHSLLQEFLPHATEVETLEYRVVTTEGELDRAMREMAAAGEFAIDTETTSPEPMRADLVGVSLSCREGTGYYIPVAHTGQGTERQLPKEDVLNRLRPLLEDAKVGKVGHNIKYDFIALERSGVRLAGVSFDTMVASYLTDPSRMRHNLDDISLHYLKRKTIPISDLIGKGSRTVTFDKVPVDLACRYSCEDADLTWRLRKLFQPLLRERGLERLFREVELPLVGVLARMEEAGVAIDPRRFEELREEVEKELGTLEHEIYGLAGARFQINSPKQLQQVLFEKLGLKPVRRTKTGYSTDVDVLEELALEHPLPEKILAYRTLEKLRGTYIEALPKLVNSVTGRIHTSFNQAVTATGRLSSSDPNLQNIPVRTEMGRRIRQGFVPASRDRRLISADYSQIELRILAHLSGDGALHEAFERDEDIHQATAARIFGVPRESVTGEMRRRAKAVNFGVVYGISPYGLARNLGVSTREAKQFIEMYFCQYPGVRRWIEATLAQAREKGYVTTILNRRRYISDLNSHDPATRHAAERTAINTPVQGSAADMIKLAMVKLDEALRGTGACLVLQVHDELVAEAPASEAEPIAATMKTIMENAVPLTVPLKVEIGIGNNWAELH